MNLFAYVPALHAGYLKLFEQFRGQTLYLLGDDFRTEAPSFEDDLWKAEVGHDLRVRLKGLERDLRAVPSSQMAEVVRALKIFSAVLTVPRARFGEMVASNEELAAPEEEEMHLLFDPYVAEGRIKVSFVSWFLRWDMPASLSKLPPVADRQISEDFFDREMMAGALDASRKSSDFWRQIGSAVVRGGERLLFSFNHHLPHGQSPYVDGDPRTSFEAGQNIECSTAIHSELALIAHAARLGTALEGANLYVTTFPCRGCANAIAEAGFAKVFYREGYSQLDADKILRRKGIELVQVI